jgi:type I restriction enzyme M protein
VILIDASSLGEKIKEGKNQKTLLSSEEENRIIETFNTKKVVEDFSVVVSYDEIEAKNYSLSAGQYFDVKVEHVDMTSNEFREELKKRTLRLQALFKESKALEVTIDANLGRLKYD